VDRYQAVLTNTSVRWSMVSGGLAYLAVGAEPLALLLVAEMATSSFASAGLVVGAYGLSSAMLAPVRGRAIDRHGGVVVAPIALLHGGTMIGLVVAAQLRAPLVVLVLLAAVAGTAFSPVFATMRSILARQVSPEYRETAYALQAIVQEMATVGGPLLAGLLIAVSSSGTALITTTAVAMVASTLFARTDAVRSLAGHGAARAHRPAILSSAALRVLALTAVPTSLSFGAVELALPAYAVNEGSPALGGVLLALIPAASFLGGLWFGSRRWRGPTIYRYLGAIVLLAACVFLLATAGNVVLLAGFLVLMGLPIAPMIACRYRLLDQAAPKGRENEAFMWISTSEAAGVAAGQACAGLVVERLGIPPTFLAAGAAAALAAAVAWTGRRRLMS
jgi:MFS family permease